MQMLKYTAGYQCNVANGKYLEPAMAAAQTYIAAMGELLGARGEFLSARGELLGAKGGCGQTCYCSQGQLLDWRSLVPGPSTGWVVLSKASNPDFEGPALKTLLVTQENEKNAVSHTFLHISH